MVVTLHGAHLAGASALANSLQLGATRASSLDPAIGIVDGCESSYAPSRGPLFFSEDDGVSPDSTEPVDGQIRQL